jgi:hypothetical protein
MCSSGGVGRTEQRDRRKTKLTWLVWESRLDEVELMYSGVRLRIRGFGREGDAVL